MQCNAEERNIKKSRDEKHASITSSGTVSLHRLALCHFVFWHVKVSHCWKILSDRHDNRCLSMATVRTVCIPIHLLCKTFITCAHAACRFLSAELLVRNRCNLVGEYVPWITLEVVGSWWHFTLTLVAIFVFFNSGYIYWMAWPSNFIFSLETHLQNI